ncbi:peptide chain release factor N(5)-glutamine methyltransferase [bacterium C-53]|nr:peptide chain release factor N(5)-glutamine methyltransferase [Lachnospiraceae bacterium]NBI02298.1 peptide chain release factor N(5)-glutamine methyltransferase [Lachnospiraceae bacterium]RKJ11961.1 peptide chain release factor N(5)-glutamine methyltransferase [bacterium C-53]
MNYRETYEYGRGVLAECGISEAKLEARLLLEYVCKKDRSYLLAHGEDVIPEEAFEIYKTEIAKRASHIPLQQITGVQEFMGFEFLVNEHVLIPRQDTETLVEEAMIEIQDCSRVLDLCTGSGCILLSLMKYKNGIEGVGADISAEALQVAKENSRRLQVEAEFIQSDMFDRIEGKFDAILCNPPYIRTDVIETLMEEVRAHEPFLALDGKEDGLHFYRILTREAGSYLQNGGALLTEIGYDQGEAVSELFREHGYKDVQVINDLAGLTRVVKGKK